MMRHLTFARALVLLTLLGAVNVHPACRSKQDPVVVLLAELENAAEDRDARGIVDHLAPEFMGLAQSDRGEVERMLRRSLAAYESVNLTVYDVQIDREEGASQGKVQFQVDFDGRPLKLGALSGFLPPSAVYRFALDVRAGESGWLVTAASWEELALKTGGE